MQAPTTMLQRRASPGPGGRAAFMASAAHRLGLTAALVVRIPGDGAPVQVSAGWPTLPAGPIGDRTLRVLAAVAEGRRGFGLWRVGARRHTHLLALWGEAPPPEAGTVLIARLTPAGHAPVDLLVGTIGPSDAPAPALMEALAEVMEAERHGRWQPLEHVDAPVDDPRIAALLEIGIELSALGTLEVVLRVALARAREIIGARYAALGVLDPTGTAIEHFLTAGIDASVRAAIGEAPRGRGVLGALLQGGGPLRLRDISRDPRSCGFPDGHPHMTSFLGAPIALGSHVFGHIYLCDKLDGPFTEADERLLVVLASQAAASVASANRLGMERERVADLEQLQHTVRAVQELLARGMSEERSLRDLLPVVIGHVRRLGGAQSACAALMEEGRLVVHAASPSDLPGLVLGSSTPGTAAEFADALRTAARQPVEVVPLRLGGELVGVLGAAGEEISEDGARAVLSAIASQLVLAVANRRAIHAERDRAGAAAALQLAHANQRATADGFRRAIQAQEAERARIARELHDEAGQVLTAVAVHLRVLEDREGDDAHRALLADLRTEVVGAATHLHELITDLRPAALREHGLAAAISQQALRLAGGTGILTDVNVAALPSRLPEETEVAIFRVVQEALTNVARHSGAESASVTAAVEGDVLRVVVEDDGRGFDPQAATVRHGLSGIRERVALLGGRLHVDSAPGRGAAVIVELDLTGRS